MSRISLIGYRGSGKSTVAALVAERLSCGWIDTDLELEASIGMSIADLVATRGEEAFRDAEAAILERLVRGYSGVLATGGGVVLRAGNRALLRSHGRPVAWLTAPAAVLRRRIAADPASATRRPPLAGRDPLADVEPALAAREPLYRECADVVVDVAEESAAQIAARLVAWLERLTGAPQAGAAGPAESTSA
ncbi:MAG: shikimate kinase [Planctomycetia bacterium]|jgi:shikimate kinase